MLNKGGYQTRKQTRQHPLKFAICQLHINIDFLLSFFRHYWDILMLLLLTINMIILPVAIAFVRDDSDDRGPLLIFNIASDILLIFDIVFNFRTGYPVGESINTFELNQKLIAIR